MPVRTRLIVGAVTLAMAFGAGWMSQGWRKDAVIAANQAQHANVLEQQAQAVVASVQAARVIEQRRTAAVEKERDNAQKQKDALADDLAAGATVSKRLRRELSALRAHHASRDPTIANRGQGERSTDTVGLLAELYARMDEVGRGVAGYADRLVIAGGACERAYDAVGQRTQ
jgi:hypothetical protein